MGKDTANAAGGDGNSPDAASRDGQLAAAARAAGLGRAWGLFADDIRAAAQLARTQGQALPELPPSAEPAPPFRPGL